MEINFTVNLDWLEEGESLDEAIKSELKHEFKKYASEIIAKHNFDEIISQKDIEDVRKEYESAISDLKNKRIEDISKIDENIRSVFHEFLCDTAYTLVNSWGSKVEKTTVREKVEKEFEEYVKDKDRNIKEIVKNYVDKHLGLSNYDVKNLVEEKSKEVALSNAKAVTEFLIKGMK